jgi:chemotaxis protein MotB
MNMQTSETKQEGNTKVTRRKGGVEHFFSAWDTPYADSGVDAVTLSSPPSYDKKEDRHFNKPAPLWLITFADIMALLLTFFVLLYSMSVPEIDRWTKMTQAVSVGMSKGKTEAMSSGDIQEISIDKISTSRALDLNYLTSLLQQKLNEDERLSGVILMQSPKSLTVSLPSSVLFDTGSAEIGVEGKRVLFTIGGVLNQIRNRIEVVGHSDPAPINSRIFDSNWELSLARAASVSSELEQSGYERNIIVRGVASARFDEMAENIPLETRLQMAKRVDIVIMEDTGQQKSFFRFSG